MDANQPAAILVAALPKHYKKVSTISLTAPALSSISEVELGGAPINSQGQWSGAWKPSPSPDGSVHIEVPPASALLIRIEK
jgi:hypothetical protein